MSRPIDPATVPPTDQDTDPAGRGIRTLLIAASEDEPPATDLLGKVRHRTRRRRTLVPSLAALGAAGVLAVAVATSTVTTTPPASAQERVAAAVTLTAQDGYRIRAVTSGTKGDRDETTVTQGVYDPAGRAVRMVEATPIKGHVIIFHLDGRVYVQLPAGVAGRQPGVPERARWFLRTSPDPNDAGISNLADFGRRALLSPQRALELAQSATDVRDVGPVSADGWAGTRFAFTLTDRHQRVTGSVDVDGDGRVRRLEFSSTSTDTAHGSAGSVHWVLTFSDFGIRERVTLPPDSQVYHDPAPGPGELAERLKNQRK
jgi:hypothetical protein